MPPLAYALASALLATAAFGQGTLIPPGAPEPTQKSLQEIWDKVGGLETQVTTVQTQITALKNQNSTLQTQLTQFRLDNQLLTSTGDYDGAGVSDVAEFIAYSDARDQLRIVDLTRFTPLSTGGVPMETITLTWTSRPKRV